MSRIKFWTTAKGQRIRFKDMTDEHIINCISVLKDKALIQKFKDKYEWTNKPKPLNPKAVKLLEKQIKDINKRKPEDMFPSYKELVKEKQRRNL